MFQSLQRLLAGALMLLMMAVIAPVNARAQTWTPNFDPQVHVYLDPALKNHPNYPVDFSKMDGELRKLSNPHQLEVYVIATERSFDPNRVIAREIADDLVARWTGRADFPRNDFLVIVWVRQASDANKGSVAAYAGNRLQSFGFNATRMDDRVNGPVIPALKQFMPRDPQSALIQIVRNINSGVDSAILAQQRAEQDRIEATKRAEQERIDNARRAEQEQIDAAKRAEQERIDNEQRAIADSERSKLIRTVAAIGIPSALLIAGLIFLTLRFRRSRARASEVLEKSRTELQNAGHWYVELEEAYLGFLKRQTDWQNRFDPKGQTAKRFAEAVGWYANLTTRKLAAADMFERAEKAFNSAHWPMSSGFDRTIAILTVEEVTVSDKNLSIEDAQLFKGLVAETKYAPGELLADMESLFNKTNKALAEIKRAFEGSAKNRAEIAELLSQVEALKAKLSELGLVFDPYQERATQISKERDEFLAILDKDPLAAFGGTQKVEQDAEQLKADIERAIHLSADLTEAAKQLASAKAAVSQQRSLKVDYAYPETGANDTEKKPAENYLLNEAGANPDDSIAEAESHLTNAGKALLAGKLDQAASEKAESCAASARVLALLAKVLEAKAYVQKQVLAVRKNLGLLQSELPDGARNVEALKAEFLEKNYAGEPAKLTLANQVNQSTEAELSKVRIAYFEQRFVAARQLLENVGAEVQHSREKLVEIATRLKQLRDLREHAGKVVAAASVFAGALKAKLKSNWFTSSAATDDAYAGLLPRLEAQKAEVARNITDWPAAAEAADKLAADFNKVDSTIDEEKKAYELAGSRIAEERAAVNSAASVVAQADTREAARAKLSQAVSALSRLENDYGHPKQDWKELAHRAEVQKGGANEAERLANADHKLAGQARSSISEVQSRIQGLAIRSFVQTVSWRGYSQVVSLGTMLDLSDANRYIGEASGCLSNKDYEGSIQACQRAGSAADKAEAWANAQLALMAQELQARWEAEERRKEEERRRQEEEIRRREEEQRRRDEEERRRREEEQRRRDEENRRSGGDNYGGGGNNSGGGNYSGGGNNGAGGGNY